MFLVRRWKRLQNRSSPSGIIMAVEVLSPTELDRVLREVQRRITETFGSSITYSFGSYASGTPTRGSDIDLLIVVPASDLSFHHRCVAAKRALAGLGHPVDVLVCTAAEFEERADWTASIEAIVRRTGRVLHAA